MLRRCASIVIVFASLYASSSALAQTVLRRARLGNNIEDITFVSTGRLAGNLAIMNGYELYVAPLHPRGGPSAPNVQTKLFDVRSTAIENGARGLAWIDSQRLFAFHSAGSGTLYLVDDNGVFRGTRAMVFPGAEPTYLEGMDYVPRSSDFYPDHLVVIAQSTDGTFTPRIDVVGLDGVVEAEIFPQAFPAGCDPTEEDPTRPCAFNSAYTMLGLAYKSLDTLLVTLNDGTNNIWALDFSGNIIGTGPVYSEAGPTSHEGIVQLSDGRIVVSNYFTGDFLFFDAAMNRLPSQDRVYSVGFGVSRPFGIAWNSANNDHVFMPTFPLALDTVSPALDSATLRNVTPPGSSGPGRITYVPSEGKIAAAVRTSKNVIRFFDPDNPTVVTGTDVDLNPALGGCPSNPCPPGRRARATAIAYIAGTNQFAVGATNDGPYVGKLVIVSRTGSFVRSIDPAPAGLSRASAAVFDDASNRFLVSDGVNAAFLNFDGSPVPGSLFNLKAALNLLNTPDLSKITSGSDAGSFGIVDLDNSEAVVFRIP